MSTDGNGDYTGYGNNQSVTPTRYYYQLFPNSGSTSTFSLLYFSSEMWKRSSVSKMAAKSGGGVDWSSIIKPILAASYGTFNKNEIIELIKAIIKRYIIILFLNDITLNG